MLYTPFPVKAKVEKCLIRKGFEIFFPQVKVCSHQGSRKKLRNIPLPPGYLFVQILRTGEKKRRLVISADLMNVAVAVQLANDAVEPYS
jgi:hypothetical protein